MRPSRITISAIILGIYVIGSGVVRGEGSAIVGSAQTRSALDGPAAAATDLPELWGAMECIVSGGQSTAPEIRVQYGAFHRLNNAMSYASQLSTRGVRADAASMFTPAHLICSGECWEMYVVVSEEAFDSVRSAQDACDEAAVKGLSCFVREWLSHL